MHVLPWMHCLSLILFAIVSFAQYLSEKEGATRVGTESASVFSYLIFSDTDKMCAYFLPLRMLTDCEIRYFFEITTCIIRLGY